MTMRSAIEMMVDQATGYDPEAHKPEPRKVMVVDEATQALMNVGDAAVAWLRARNDPDNLKDAERVLVESARVLKAAGW